jgi:hypothetical protein
LPKDARDIADVALAGNPSQARSNVDIIAAGCLIFTGIEAQSRVEVAGGVISERAKSGGRVVAPSSGEVQCHGTGRRVGIAGGSKQCGRSASGIVIASGIGGE